jgi:thiol peroxidase
VALITITLDLPFAQKRYCAAEGIDNMTVVSDYQDRDFGLKYGFLMEELKLLTRGVVIIGRDRMVKYVQYVPEVGHEPDYEAVLEAIEALI